VYGTSWIRLIGVLPAARHHTIQDDAGQGVATGLLTSSVHDAPYTAALAQLLCRRMPLRRWRGSARARAISRISLALAETYTRWRLHLTQAMGGCANHAHDGNADDDGDDRRDDGAGEGLAQPEVLHQAHERDDEQLSYLQGDT